MDQYLANKQKFLEVYKNYELLMEGNLICILLISYLCWIVFAILCFIFFDIDILLFGKKEMIFSK